MYVGVTYKILQLHYISFLSQKLFSPSSEQQINSVHHERLFMMQMIWSEKLLIGTMAPQATEFIREAGERSLSI